MTWDKIGLAAIRILARCPWWMLYGISNGLSWLMYWVIGYRRKVVMGNLELAFPNKSDSERKKVARSFYINFSDIVVEVIKSHRITAKEMKQRFKVSDASLFERLHAEGRGVMVVMGHYTNFEWTAMALGLCVPQNTYAVYHPIKNRTVNDFMVRIRQKFGMTLFSMKETYPFMLGQEDDRPLYIFMADQSPHRGKIKYAAPFFHPYTPVHLGVENLAKKCDLAVVFIETHRLSRGHYEVRPTLLVEDAQSTGKYEITKRHLAALEAAIRRQPEAWMWTHRRWKNVKDAQSFMEAKEEE
jgi:KDO2-lipid IV(A) lauroyltransferase